MGLTARVWLRRRKPGVDHSWEVAMGEGPRQPWRAGTSQALARLPVPVTSSHPTHCSVPHADQVTVIDECTYPVFVSTMLHAWARPS